MTTATPTRKAKRYRPVSNVALLPCRNQMNLTRQLHGSSTGVVSSVEFNSVAPIQNKQSVSIRRIRVKTLTQINIFIICELSSARQ